jgi:hypothetical protein
MLMRKFIAAAFALLAGLGALCIQQAHAQDAARTHVATASPEWASVAPPPYWSDLYRGPRWGQGGPWADQDPYAPPPKPPGWIDPEPSRWRWTGERDPYDYAGRGQLHEPPWFTYWRMRSRGGDSKMAVGP